jgi:uncharacterized protein involved in exopolysaccharide biosynthesis
MNTALPVGAEAARTVTLADLVRASWQLRGYWLGGAVAGILAGVAAALFMTPVYRASITVMPVVDARQVPAALPGLLSRFGGGAAFGLGDDGGREEALAVLRSRQFTAAFIDEQQLLPELFAERWDAATGDWLPGDPADVPTAWQAWQRFDLEVRHIREDRDRGLVTIDVDWRDPVLAARWANLLVDGVNEELRGRRLARLERSLELLQVELERAELAELRQAIAGVIQTQVNERMLAMTRRDFAFRIIDPAEPPDLDRPRAPKPALYAALGFSAGAILGLLAGFVRRYAREVTAPPG